MPRLHLLLGLALGVLAWPVHAAEELHRFYGYAYDLKTGAYLYTEVHEQKIQGDRWIGGNIVYLAPDGSEMGRKTLDFGSNEFIPTFKLSLKHEGYSEGISAVGKTMELFKQSSRDAKVERTQITVQPGMAADSGFHTYLRAHFDELMQGKTLEFRFVVAGNLDTFKFRARKVGQAEFEGKPAVKIEAEANSLLRLVAPKLELLYEPRERQLLEYRGISNLHDPKTDEPFQVRIGYYSTPPADAPKLRNLQ